MIVDCHSCGATYNISDDKVRGRRVRVRCKTCGEGIIVDGASLDDATRVYSPTFEPAAYSEDRDDDRDESTRVMSANGMEWRRPAPAEPAPEDWTVNLSDTEQRTMTTREVVSGYLSGTVGDDAFVWRDGMSDWLPVRQVPELRTAIESGESTRVMSAAALRAATAAVPLATPPPPPPPPPALTPQVNPPPARGQVRSAVAAPTPVTYAAPSAPPRSVRAAPPPAASVEYAPSAPQWPTVGTRQGAAGAARVREGRARADLFGGGAPVDGSEEDLLRSSSVPLEQYDEKPTGARNESSVLFSLDTLKAGAQRTGSSAPPRLVAAAPPTAADILGMTAGGALPGLDSSAALLSAPMVNAPVAPPAPALPPAREKMDTTPPMMRGRTPMGLIVAILALAAAIVGGGVAVYKSRVAPAAPEAATNVVASPAVPAAAPVPAPAPSPTTPVAAPTPAPEPVPEPAAPKAEVREVAPAAPAAPPKASPAPAAPKSGGSSLEAMKAALKPDKGSGEEKVVLAEEAPAAPADPPAEAPAEETKPPFDAASAKSALAAAASNAASCKKPDGPTGSGKVQVTFSPSGRATSANVVEGAFGGTSVGGCVAKLFRAAKVPAFSGDPVTVAKSFTIPED